MSVQYTGWYAVDWGMFSTQGGGISLITPRGVQYDAGYHEYTVEVLSTVGDTMNTSGGYHEYSGGYHNEYGEIS